MSARTLEEVLAAHEDTYDSEAGIYGCRCGVGEDDYNHDHPRHQADALRAWALEPEQVERVAFGMFGDNHWVSTTDKARRAIRDLFRQEVES